MCLLVSWAICASVPYTGDMSPACELRKGSLQGPCLLWYPEDPGFGHRASRLGYECFFDVALLPLWLTAFYFGGFDSEHGWAGPITTLSRSRPLSHLGRWVWGMYIFREPVHILLLLALPARIRLKTTRGRAFFLSSCAVFVLRPVTPGRSRFCSLPLLRISSVDPLSLFGTPQGRASLSFAWATLQPYKLG